MIKLNKAVIFSVILAGIGTLSTPAISVSAASPSMSRSIQANIDIKRASTSNKPSQNIYCVLTAKENEIVELQETQEKVVEVTGGLTRNSGVNYHNGWRETYYSSNVLRHYRIGEWSTDANGVYRDSDGYVIVASTSDPFGSIVSTSFGAGKVYDTGCDAGTHDIYTNW